MEKKKYLGLFACSILLALIFISASVKSSKEFPYEQAGLTERRAAEILLDRFAFGPRPGDVDKVADMGIEIWFHQQLEGNLQDSNLNGRLLEYPQVNMSEEQILATYPNRNVVVKEAKKDGAIPDSANVDVKEYKDVLMNYMEKKGYLPESEINETLLSQKILRASYSENQLREVMTDFWFNHFNVSLTTGQTRNYMLSYERDAIRPNSLGNFRDLLEATAKHPAMLYYLNNAESVADEGRITTGQIAARENQARIKFGFINSRQLLNQMMRTKMNNAVQNNNSSQSTVKKKNGINENYGRELMELHTLGVDGGYTQHDVIEVARCFTGWTVMPQGDYAEKLLSKKDQLEKLDFVFDGQFLFNANQHDAEQKVVLGYVIPAGGGMNDGDLVLNILAQDPATARHISKQLAEKFVSDNPPESLINKMTDTFLQTKGDIKSVLLTIVNSPEFWKEAKTHSKIKSPFELAISSIRALNADVINPLPVSYWIARMGQPLYSYLAPTGYPDNAKSWINTGSLLNRMNFGLFLASSRIKGINFDLYALNNDREPESVDAALKAYVKIFMPERDLTSTINLLTPSVRDPDFAKKISEKAKSNNQQNTISGNEEDKSYKNKKSENNSAVFTGAKFVPKDLSNVVGLIIGSPEFQRR